MHFNYIVLVYKALAHTSCVLIFLAIRELIIPILQVRKLKPKKVEHTSIRSQSQETAEPGLKSQVSYKFLVLSITSGFQLHSNHVRII